MHGARDIPPDRLNLVEGPADPARDPSLLHHLDPAEARLILAMRRDRAILASLPALVAPADLLEGVAARLERSALLAIADGETPDPIPLSRPVVVVDRRRLAWRGPALGALAATVILTTAVTLFLAFTSRTPRNEPFDIASNDPVPPDPMTIAKSDPAPEPPTATTPEEGSALATAPPIEEAPQHSVSAPDFTRLADLAREGRLAIRVRTQEVGRAEGRFTQLAARSPREDWRLMGEVDAVIAAEVRANQPCISAAAQPLIVASWGGSEVAPMMFAAAVPLPPPTLRPRTHAVYAAEIDATPESVESLLRALAVGDRDRVIVMELDEPIPGPPPSLDPERVFWWTLAPGEWRRPAFIAVSIETLE